MAPRGPQMAPRPLQEPKMSPRCSKIAPRRPQHGAPEHGKRCSRLGAVQFLWNWPISVLPFASLFSPVLSQPNLASRWPEDGPKMPQDGSKMAPGKPKMAPRWPRQTPGWPKKGPRRHGQTPRLPSMAPKLQNIAQGSPKMALDSPKMAQHCPKKAQFHPKRWPHVADQCLYVA